MHKTVSPPLDARCALISLILCNVITFTQSAIWLEFSLFAYLTILLIICGCKNQALKWFITLIIVLVMQYTILPHITFSFTAGFAIMFSYLRKMIPCLMIGTIIVKKIPSQYLILALRKFHFPQAIVIPLAVTIRYIPSIKEEFIHIRDAMKLREIHGFKKVECTIVPLIISATNTADELSAAAVTRGVENPCKKTSIFSMTFKPIDYITLTVTVSFAVLSLMTKVGIL